MLDRSIGSEMLRAVVLAGGRGGRMFPFSKVVPKELLPVGVIPAIDRVVWECVSAGCQSVTVVVRPGDTLIQRYFSEDPLEFSPNSAQRYRFQRYRSLITEGRLVFVEESRSIGYGSGVPILQLEPELKGLSEFAVLFADDVIVGGSSAISEVHGSYLESKGAACAAIAYEEVPPESIMGRFGCLTPTANNQNTVFRVARFTQKPKDIEHCTKYAVVSRLVLNSLIFDALRKQLSKEVELDLGMAVSTLIQQGATVVATPLSGAWITVGDFLNYRNAWNSLTEDFFVDLLAE